MGLDVNVYKVEKGGSTCLSVDSYAGLATHFSDHVYAREVRETRCAGEYIDIKKLTSDFGLTPDTYGAQIKEIYDPKGEIAAYEFQFCDLHTGEDAPEIVMSSTEVEEKYTVVSETAFEVVTWEQCVDCVELGWQRKGANDQFYIDNKWDTVVFTKDELVLDWARYFSDTPNDRQRFKENIVDKFIEGETIVCYH